MKPDSSTPKRSFLKALSWETFSNLLTFGLALVMFGDVAICTVFFIVGFILKLALYYLHERIWHQVAWGKSCSN